MCATATAARASWLLCLLAAAEQWAALLEPRLCIQSASWVSGVPVDRNCASAPHTGTRPCGRSAALVASLSPTKNSKVAAAALTKAGSSRRIGVTSCVCVCVLRRPPRSMQPPRSRGGVIASGVLLPRATSRSGAERSGASSHGSPGAFTWQQPRRSGRRSCGGRGVRG